MLRSFYGFTFTGEDDEVFVLTFMFDPENDGLLQGLPISFSVPILSFSSSYREGIRSSPPVPVSELRCLVSVESSD